MSCRKVPYSFLQKLTLNSIMSVLRDGVVVFYLEMFAEEVLNSKDEMAFLLLVASEERAGETQVHTDMVVHLLQRAYPERCQVATGAWRWLG